MKVDYRSEIRSGGCVRSRALGIVH